MQRLYCVGFLYLYLWKNVPSDATMIALSIPSTIPRIASLSDVLVSPDTKYTFLSFDFSLIKLCKGLPCCQHN